MITLFLLFFLMVLVIVLIAVIFAAITGIIAALPAILIIASLLLVDVVFFKLMKAAFGGNKDKEE